MARELEKTRGTDLYMCGWRGSPHEQDLNSQLPERFLVITPHWQANHLGQLILYAVLSIWRKFSGQTCLPCTLVWLLWARVR